MVRQTSTGRGRARGLPSDLEGASRWTKARLPRAPVTAWSSQAVRVAHAAVRLAGSHLTRPKINHFSYHLLSRVPPRYVRVAPSSRGFRPCHDGGVSDAAPSTAAPLPALPEDGDRVLVVVAHPDDAEYGTAAAGARWTAQGTEVVYVMATSG